MHDAPVGKRPGRRPYKPSASARERVMTYIAAGMTLPQIADALVISRTTLCKCFVAGARCRQGQADGREYRPPAQGCEVRQRVGHENAHGALCWSRWRAAETGTEGACRAFAQTAGVGTEWEGDLLPSQPQPALDDDQATDWGTDLYPAGNYGRFGEFEK